MGGRGNTGSIIGPVVFRTGGTIAQLVRFFPCLQKANRQTPKLSDIIFYQPEGFQCHLRRGGRPQVWLACQRIKLRFPVCRRIRAQMGRMNPASPLSSHDAALTRKAGGC